MSEQNNSAANTATWRERILHLPRRVKRSILIITDLILLYAVLWAAMSVRLAEFYVPPNWSFAILLGAAPIISVITFHNMRLYRQVTRFIGLQATMQIYAAVAVSVLIWGLLVLMSGITGMPRSVILLYGLLSATLVWLSRQAAAWLLKADQYKNNHDKNQRAIQVVIYGAGKSGVQLRQALDQSALYHPVGFIDEDKSLWRQVVGGLKVYRPDKITALIENKKIEEVFLALPNLARHKKQQLIHSLAHLPLKIKTLPNLEDIASGRVQISDLRPIEVDDLLGRDPVPADPALLTKTITDKTVMVTGAGGSIGSEIARQIIKLTPKKLILFEVSEAALYMIDMELRELIASLVQDKNLSQEQSARLEQIEIVPILGSILDKQRIEKIFETYRIDTLFHAAAYKHVPLVEANPFIGLQNNTLGTAIIAKAAREKHIERFVLISSDKAVRPTNVMGASKRLAELVLQAHADDPKCKTIFTMVRFGNVLGSSGSVVQRFRKQISAGGPVTVTHRDIIRYFMSIPEAAELVIQAGAMGQGGDVFVLDMGEAVKIDNLARTMIRLTGLEVRDENHPDGDIEIRYVGLRDGEKLYEELLIGENTEQTEHPRILRNREQYFPYPILAQELEQLKNAITQNDIEQLYALLSRTVENYQPFENQGNTPSRSLGQKTSASLALPPSKTRPTLH